MKQIKFILLLIFSLNTTCIYADDAYSESGNIVNYDTYGGVNFKQNWIEPKGQWKRLFVEPQPGFNVYFGWRFHPYFAAEFGYEWTANKPSSTVIPNGSSILGVSNATGTPITMTGKVRFKTGHLDLNAFIPLIRGCEINPEAIISIGVANMKPSMKIYPSPLNATTSPFTSKFSPIEGRSNAVFRFGLGLQTLLVENVGARVIWRFENTSVLRGRNSIVTESSATRELFKNAQTLAIGLFLKF